MTEQKSNLLVEPQPYVESSYFSTVSNILTQVLPQSGAAKPAVADLGPVKFLRFETGDVNDVRLLLAEEGDLYTEIAAPPLLIIGYARGYQIWLLLANGRAQLLVSNSAADVSLLRILSTPSLDGNDEYKTHRPIMVVVGLPLLGNKQQPASTVLSFYSMKTNELCRLQTFFKSDILDVQSTARFVVVSTLQKVSILDASSLEGMAVIRDCFTPETPVTNPFALGDSWLAYQTTKVVKSYASCCHLVPAQEETYTASVLSAAKVGAATLGQGVSLIGGAVSRLAGQQVPTSSVGQNNAHEASHGHLNSPLSSVQPGVVAVLDLDTLARGHQATNKVLKFSVADAASVSDAIVVHFLAHRHEPIVHMMFDKSGILLLTCGETGRNFHLFRIKPHCAGSVMSSVQHLYTLHRGHTEATVCNSAFSQDSRWVTVGTTHGTSHVFAVTPYGGSVEMRTHESRNVVNRCGRFHTSAGLENARSVNVDTVTSGTSPPSSRPIGNTAALSSSSSSLSKEGSDASNFMRALRGNSLIVAHPRYRDAAKPSHLLSPLAQIKQSTTLGTTACSSGSSLVASASGIASTLTYFAQQGISSARNQLPSASSSPPAAAASSPPRHHVCVASTFALPRFSRFSNPAAHAARLGWETAGTQQSNTCRESLFVITSDSHLIEYQMVPHPQAGTTGRYAPLAMTETPLATWDLHSYTGVLDCGLPLPAFSALQRYSELAANTTSFSAMQLAFGCKCCTGLDCIHNTGSPGSNMRLETISSLPPTSAARPIPVARRHEHSAASGAPVNGVPEVRTGSVNAASEWVQHLEKSSHLAPQRRLWMGPQFEFRQIKGAPSCDSSPASVHSADSASAALLPLEDKCKKCVRYRSVPLVVNSRAREVPVSGTDNTMEVYGSWQDFAPQSGRSVDSHSMSSFEMESTLLDAMRDASLGDDINSLGDDITGAESNPDLSSVATVPVGLGGLSGMSPNRPVLADIDDDMTENLQF